MNNQFEDNTPVCGYVPRIHDYVLAWDGKRKLSGYVESIGHGNFKMYNGPTFPDSHILKFVRRNGSPRTSGTSALPVDHF